MEQHVKVMLHNDGEDVETVWAEPCGSHAGVDLIIVDYARELEPRFPELSRWLEQDVIPEGCYGTRPDKPGRLYLAVRKDVEPQEVFAALRERFGEGLTWVHPCEDEDEG